VAPTPTGRSLVPPSGTNSALGAPADAPLDRWLERHAAFVTLVVLAAGFLLRLRAASSGYLHPDEAYFYILADQPSLGATYKLALHDPHPPLFCFLLHFLRVLGHSELILRLPSVLAGTFLPCFGYKWLRTIFGARTGWIGMLLLTFSPPMITQSVQVRQYALLVFFLVAALYFLERALGEDSLSKMALFSLFLLLAIATHYSTPWFVIVSGVYAFGRIRRAPPSRAVTRTLLGSMAAAAALIQFFFVTHVAKLATSGLTAWMVNTSWLSALYFHPAKTSAVKFVAAHSVWFFQYLFGQAAVGFAMLAAFLIAASLLLDPKLPLPGKAPPRLLAVLVLLPFLIASGAGLARLYPYGPVREDLWLLPFAIAGVSYGLGQLGGRRRAWPALGLAGLVVFSGLYAVPTGIQLPPNLSRNIFEAPLSYIRQAIPEHRPVLTDLSTMLTLGYYLCDDEGFPLLPALQGFAEYRCGGYRFLVSPQQTFTPANFPGEVEQAAKTYRLDPGQSLWVVHAAWAENSLGKVIPSLPEFRLPTHQTFGDISIFQVVIPQPGGPGN
jgi:Dolichyl-phosphate-mannose-protein mannosyltransferase